ncbi:hypothetical protein T5B8_03401 [Salinisphaera sp. T5B8]
MSGDDACAVAVRACAGAREFELARYEIGVSSRTLSAWVCRTPIAFVRSLPDTFMLAPRLVNVFALRHASQRSARAESERHG